MGIRGSIRDYERWLGEQLGDELIEDDLKKKHKKMRESAFSFLRATYWRWAETIFDVCPDLADAPSVLAVGDIHIENFGTWRDAEGRLVWGVNDFDECAEMPYVLDLVRLAVSAVLAKSGKGRALAGICADLVEGYEQGLAAPEAFVLDRRYMWLRKRFVVSESERLDFWRKMLESEDKTKAAKSPEEPPKAVLKALASALPEPAIQLRFWRRAAGTGSLGRPRWVGYGVWRDGPLLREAKALVPSGWERFAGRGGGRRRINDIADGLYRSPDPRYRATGDVLVRRLSPNNRKLEVTDRLQAGELLHPDMLWAMGRDLAAIHLGVRNRRDAIVADLDRRKRRWFRTNVETAVEFVRGEHREWAKK